LRRTYDPLLVERSRAQITTIFARTSPANGSTAARIDMPSRPGGAVN